MNAPEQVTDPVSRSMYDEGRTGIDIAEFWVAAVIAGLIETRIARAYEPDAVPEWGPDISPQFAARRVVARLLDAGWRPADPKCLDPFSEKDDRS